MDGAAGQHLVQAGAFGQFGQPGAWLLAKEGDHAPFAPRDARPGAQVQRRGAQRDAVQVVDPVVDEIRQPLRPLQAVAAVVVCHATPAN
ncbi:hypothetical protein D3C86_1932460 [compost metagenome]